METASVMPLTTQAPS